MRFFSGVRNSSDKKKNSASELFKKKLSGKPELEKTANEKYQEVIDARMHKMMEDAIMGRKKAVSNVPGFKQSDKEFVPKELSKNAQVMLKLLAMQKLKRDEKRDKKKLRALEMQAKAKKKAEAAAKAAKDAQADYEKRQADEAAAAAATAAATAAAETATSQQNYSYGSTLSEDAKSWW